MYLVILRGLPASGKSTWVRSQGLSQYVVSSDALRLLCGNATFNVQGWVDIAQTHQPAVWDIVYKVVEMRLRRRMFTVLDTTCIRLRDLRSWVSLARSFGVIPVVVDFTGVPEAECRERDRARVLKNEPCAGTVTLDRMASRLETSRSAVEDFLCKESVQVFTPGAASSWLPNLRGRLG